MSQEWKLLGTKSFKPSDLSEVVGSFSLEEGADTLWIRITLLSPSTPWPWSYGIIGFKTASGYELGTQKAYAKTDAEVYRLGVGRTPSERDGVLTYEPRSFNLRWIKEGYPLVLKFEYASEQKSETPFLNDDAIGSFETFDPDNGAAGMDFSLFDGLSALILYFLGR